MTHDDGVGRSSWSVALEPFGIGVVPVTKALYAQVMGAGEALGPQGCSAQADTSEEPFPGL